MNKNLTVFVVHNIPLSYYGIMKERELDDLQYSDEYGEYILTHNDEHCIANGDMLLVLMEDGYLFDDFLNSIGYEQ